jgi:cellobiose phosphorylase
MVGTVEGILGLRPTPDGIVINPSTPSEWTLWKMTKKLRGKTLKIRVSNPGHSQHGVKCITVNGKKMEGNFIPDSALKAVNDVLVEM